MQNDSSIYKVPHLEDFEDAHFEDFEEAHFDAEPENNTKNTPSPEPEITSQIDSIKTTPTTAHEINHAETTPTISPEIDNAETTPTTISVFQELNAIAEEIEQCRRRNT